MTTWMWLRFLKYIKNISLDMSFIWTFEPAKYLDCQTGVWVWFKLINNDKETSSALVKHSLSKKTNIPINKLPWINCFWFSRCNHKGSGGLVILANNNLVINKLNVKKFCNEMEFESATILKKIVNLTGFVIYRPPCYLNVNRFF